MRLKTIRIAILTVAAVVLLAACQGTTPTPQPPAEPMVEEPELHPLIGTYRAQFEDEGNLETVTLTFTASRWIWHNTGVDYQQSGGFRIEGTTLTKTWYDHETESIQSVDKQFRLDGTDLVVDPWDWGEPAQADVERERYAKVQNPLPASMIGSWAGMRYEEKDGEPRFTETWRFILREDATATFEVAPTPDFVKRPSPGADPYPPACWHGTLTIDTSELFLIFTDTTSNARERNDVNVEVYEDKVWRSAYAPTDQQAAIVMSSFWNDQLDPGHALPVEEQIAAVWLDNPRAPFGDYWITLTREPASDRVPCEA